jgi:hypothetical protein
MGTPRRNRETGGRASKWQNDKKWAWKLKAPKEKDPKTKKVDDKTYHWCPNHSAWTLHNTDPFFLAWGSRRIYLGRPIAPRCNGWVRNFSPKCLSYLACWNP